MQTWRPTEWETLSRRERQEYRAAHAAEIATAKKLQRHQFRRTLARAVLEVAEFGDILTGDEKFEQATALALAGLDRLLAFDELRGELALLGVPAEKVTDWILYRSPFRAWVEGEIQDLYELGFEELRKLAGGG